MNRFYSHRRALTPDKGVRRLVFCAQCAGGVIAIGMVSVLGLLLHLTLSSVGILSLLVVTSVSVCCGFWQATVVSLVALVCQLYFFVPPIYTWAVANPQDYVVLVVFECTALMVSRLSANTEKLARETGQRRRDMEELYELSRRSLQLDLHRPPGAKLLEMIAEIFEVDAVAIFDAELHDIDSWGQWPVDVTELAQNTYLFEVNQDDAAASISRRVLSVGSAPVGALLLRGNVSPLRADAIASLISITFDRYRSLANETRAEAAQQNEELRASVLDRLAHAFKTPLTAIRTASAGLLEVGMLSPIHADLATLIEEESMALNDLTTRLLQTASLEAGQIDLKREQIVVADVIREIAAEHADRLGNRSLVVSIDDASLAATVDRELFSTIIRQFVDNALKYSYPGSNIGISAEESASEIVISVHNEGDPIRLEDRERIFDRYYRCPEMEHRVSGTGLGLSIARTAAEAHGGHVWVISEKDAGTTFYLSIQGIRRGADEQREQPDFDRR